MLDDTGTANVCGCPRIILGLGHQQGSPYPRTLLHEQGIEHDVQTVLSVGSLENKAESRNVIDQRVTVVEQLPFHQHRHVLLTTFAQRQVALDGLIIESILDHTISLHASQELLAISPDRREALLLNDTIENVAEV